MNRNTVVWVVVFGLGAAGLAWRAAGTGMGSQYVRAIEVHAASKTGQQFTWTRYDDAFPKDRGQPDVALSTPRTLGVWVAALMTLGAFSFLFGDNPLFKLTQAIVIGTSAGFAVCVGFWSTVVPMLMGRLHPEFVRSWAAPGMPPDQQTEWIALVPLALCLMLLWRLAPWGGWISRWPLAFFIGLTAGLRLVTFFKADFVDQVANTILPLAVMADGRFDPWATLKNLAVLAAVLATLAYFLFSVEHAGAMGRAARLGICVLMITFGASFSLTVMGRISMLAARLQFLFDDWLWLIDPLNRRTGL